MNGESGNIINPVILDNTVDKVSKMLNPVSQYITVGKVIIIVLFLLIIYITTRLHYTLKEIQQNWDHYSCRFPYSAFGGFLAPHGIKGDDLNKDKVFYGMEGSKINYNRCNDKLYKETTDILMAPVYDVFGSNISKLKDHKNDMSMLTSVGTDVKNVIGDFFKKVMKMVLVVYYIMVYIFQKLKMILMKIQGVISVILDSFKAYLVFVNYLIFTVIPKYLQYIIAAQTFGLSYLLWGVIGSSILPGMGVAEIIAPFIEVITSVLSISGPGASLTLAGAAGAAAGAYYVILWLLNASKNILQSFNINGIGNLPLFPTGGETYDYAPDNITAGYSQENSAGSLLNLLQVFFIAIQDENDTTNCLIKSDKIRLKDEIVALQDIKLGDKQEDDSIIIGMVKYKSSKVQLYNYKDVIMTGSHYIQQGDQMVKCSSIGKLDRVSEEEVYCPITSNGLILAQGTEEVTLADYNDGKSYTEWNYEYSKRLNNKECDHTEFKKHNYPALFASRSELDSGSSSSNKIADVEHIYLPSIKMYNYKGIILSGNVLVFEDNTWKRIFQTRAILVTYKLNLDKLYNIITKDHIIDIDGNTFRDYEEL